MLAFKVSASQGKGGMGWAQTPPWARNPAARFPPELWNVKLFSLIICEPQLPWTILGQLGGWVGDIWLHLMPLGEGPQGVM